MLNSPANPTGVVYTADELRCLALLLRRHPRVWVLSDDIYEKLIYDDVSFATMAAAAPELADRTLTVNGLSKSHAMTGWRVGYGAGPRELIRAMNMIQSQTTSHTASMSQHAAVEALTGDDSFLDHFRAQYRDRRDLVERELEPVPGLTIVRPRGAFYVFVSCRGLIGARTPRGATITSDTELAMYLLEEGGTAVVPGAGFLASPYVRISFASASEAVREGCARIALACRRLDPVGP
jgi:aspartate aminotransferase